MSQPAPVSTPGVVSVATTAERRAYARFLFDSLPAIDNLADINELTLAFLDELLLGNFPRKLALWLLDAIDARVAELRPSDTSAPPASIHPPLPVHSSHSKTIH